MNAILHTLHTQLQLFLTAIQFYTRLPLPSTWIAYSSSQLSPATRYFPLIGWLVAGSAGLVFIISIQFWNFTIAVLLSMVASVLVTGAFHEDGLADMCDGLGGGWSAEQVLTIMKDSRVGTYGLVGLGLVLALKAATLSTMPPAQIVLALWVGHSVSRLSAVAIIATFPYARADATSKVKPVAQQLSWTTLIIAGILGSLPLLWLPWLTIGLIILTVAGLTAYLGWVFQRRLGGYTGDCLGATQQLNELACYLVLAA